MARRFQRTYARVPIDLVPDGRTEGLAEAGSILNFSDGGFRVQTGPQLIPGGTVHLFLEGNSRPFVCCRVVWARSHGDALPSEAGLEILERLPSHSAQRLHLRPLVSRPIGNL